MRERPAGDMDFDFFKRIVVEMRLAGVEELGLFYLGESFLYDRLPDAIRFAKEEAGYPYVFLTTNGSASSPDKVAECLAAGLDSLKFSLNYADEDQFEEIARVNPKNFRKSLENARNARRVRDFMKSPCGLYASYIEYDNEQALKVKAMVDSVRDCFDEIYALPLYNQAAQVDHPDWKFIPGNTGRAANARDPLPCWSAFTEGHITHDGYLSACCFDHNKKFEMGNLNEVSFMEAWHSQPFQELRQAHLNLDVRGTVCENCVK
jgi:radical SAM protein with 4Fe4S-binding SPASM domain